MKGKVMNTTTVIKSVPIETDFYAAYSEARQLLEISPSTLLTRQYDQPELAPLLNALPAKRMMLKLDNMNRTEVGRMKESDFTSPLFEGVDSKVIASRLKYSLSSVPGKISDFEVRYLDDWGPPFSSAYRDYEDDRLIPHYYPYTSSTEEDELKTYADELAAMFPRYPGKRMISESLHDRQSTSSLGPYHLTSWSRLSDIDRNRTRAFAMFADESLQRKRMHPVLIIPGTRVSHAPDDALPEDRNRVIMMVDIFSHLLLHSRLSPLAELMRKVQPLSAIHRRENVRDFLRTLDKLLWTFISCDSSRQDAAVKVGPPLNVYLYFLSKVLPPDIYEEVRLLELSHHFPIYFSPFGVYTGMFGNPSGAYSTTFKNSVLTYFLGRALVERLRKHDGRQVRYFIFTNGDDLTEAILTEDLDHAVPIVPTITSTYHNWGFTAKPSKQMVSRDTMLFCKTAFSQDPLIGPQTMAAGNGFKKLLWRRPRPSVDMAKTADFALDDTTTAITYINIAKAILETRKWSRNGYRDLPSPDSSWPYYIIDPLAFQALDGVWNGPQGPVLDEDLAACFKFAQERPDLVLEPTFGLGFLQSIGELRYHPQMQYCVETILNYITAPFDEIFSDLVINALRNGVPSMILDTRFPLQNQRVYLLICKLLNVTPDAVIRKLVDVTYVGVRFKIRRMKPLDYSPIEELDRILSLI